MAIITGKPSEEVRQWCASNHIEYFLKPVAKSTFERFLGVRAPRAFLVHGRNKQALRAVKAALKSVGIEPVVLMELASLGRTVIEKFEEVAESCDCAVVLLSPDDIGNLVQEARAGHKARFRARQNVLFELGYFCGSLGRRRGAVVLLEHGSVEIPSDLAGVVRINSKVSRAALRKALKEELAWIL